MSLEKYAEVAGEAFSRLGFRARPGQLEAVCDIVSGFIDLKLQNQILCAPTGTGKSIIGLVVAEVLSTIKGNVDSKSSIILSATNMLLQQYDESFSTPLKGKFIMIKGASNYNCGALSEPNNSVGADSCAWHAMVRGGGFSDIVDRHCTKCEYLHNKKQKNLSRHLTTNYSYYFIDRMYTGKFEDRDIVVWDEAHLINDLFSEHNAIYFSQRRLLAAAQEIADTVRLTDLSISKLLSSTAVDCATPGKINDTNYQSYLRALQKIYAYAVTAGEQAAAAALRSNKMSTYTGISRFIKKYEGLGCKISDLFSYNYEHIFEYKSEDCSVSVKPIFMGSMFGALQTGPHNLFMSATVNSNYLVKTLGLDAKRTRFIKLAPTFAPENKEIIFFSPISLSYSSLQRPETVRALRQNVAKIVRHHTEAQERGIILSPSFKLQGELVAELAPLVKKGAVKLFEHRQGEKLEAVLAQFKAWRGLPAVLISPAMYEGIDLPGDQSRYQIFVKAPYPSLADRRMKFILDNHADLYELITIKKCIQGAGRSVRSVSDYAKTYMLDTNAQRLLQSPANIWRDEFSFKFKNMF